MATHNQAMLVGYLEKDPIVYPNGQGVVLRLRVMHRDDTVYSGGIYQSLLVHYSEHNALMDKMAHLKELDVVFIKGVLKISPCEKFKRCKKCGHTQEYYRGTQGFIHPIHLVKINSMRGLLEDEDSKRKTAEDIMSNLYQEISNQIIVMGNVVDTPVRDDMGKVKCLKYQLGIDRKYFIRSQELITSDFPWVYSYQDLAVEDQERLKKGTLVMVDGFIRQRQFATPCTCEKCGNTYKHIDTITEIIPYATEYLTNYITDEDIEKQEQFAEFDKQQDINRILEDL